MRTHGSFGWGYVLEVTIQHTTEAHGARQASQFTTLGFYIDVFLLPLALSHMFYKDAVSHREAVCSWKPKQSDGAKLPSFLQQ